MLSKTVDDLLLPTSDNLQFCPYVRFVRAATMFDLF